MLLHLELVAAKIPSSQGAGRVFTGKNPSSETELSIYGGKPIDRRDGRKLARLSKLVRTAQLYISSKINTSGAPLWKNVHKLWLLDVANKAVGNAISMFDLGSRGRHLQTLPPSPLREQIPNPGAVTSLPQGTAGPTEGQLLPALLGAVMVPPSLFHIERFPAPNNT